MTALPAVPHLSRSQRQVLDLAVQGFTIDEAARSLRISTRAVEYALERIRVTLGARNTPHACALAVAYGIVTRRQLFDVLAAAADLGIASTAGAARLT